MCTQYRLLSQGSSEIDWVHSPSHATTDLIFTAPSLPSPQINRFHFTQPMNPTNAIQFMNKAANGTAPPKKVSRVASGTKHSGSGSQKWQDAPKQMTQTSKKPIDCVLAAKSASSSSSSSKKIPDADKEPEKKCYKKGDRAADVLTIFQLVDPEDTSKGYCCTGCEAEAEAAGLDPDTEINGDSQHSILNFAQKVQRPQDWTKDGLLDRILHFVIETDQALSITDHTSFRELLVYQRHKTEDSDIPYHTKVTECVLERADAI
ncbi:hypothetical protein C8R48DRAFT_676653 [Suillus tomentosus]|nr:hypothetical protein C8R48DRAFT_676653 [Suillus tomentosus]